MTDIAKLGLEVDTAGLLEGVRELNRLAEAADKTGTEASKLEAQNLRLSKQWMEQAVLTGKTTDEVIRYRVALNQMTGDAAQAASMVADGIQKRREEAEAIKRVAEEQKRLQEEYKSSAAAKFGEMIDMLIAKLAKMAISLVSVGAAMKAIRDFAQAEEISNKLSSMLEITGNKAGRSAEQLEEFASSLSRLTRFDDDAIKRAQTVLVRMGQVAGDNLDRATKLSLDLAEAMGTDAAGAAQMLGRAMETAYGAQMLRRQGYLTEEQSKQIKNLKELNQDTEAQVALFDALEKRIGGVAEEMGQKGLATAFQQLGNEMGEASEDVGAMIADITNLENVVRNLAVTVGVIRNGSFGNVLNAMGRAVMEPGVNFATAIRDEALRLARQQKEDADNARRERDAAQGWSPDQSDAAAEAAARVASGNVPRGATAAELERNAAVQLEVLEKIYQARLKDNAAIKTRADAERAVASAMAADSAKVIELYGSEKAAVEALVESIKKKEKAAKPDKEDTEYKKMIKDLDDVTKAQERYNDVVNRIAQQYGEGKISEAKAINDLELAYRKLNPAAVAYYEAIKAGQAQGTEAQTKLADEVKALDDKAAALTRTTTATEAYEQAQIELQIAQKQNELRDLTGPGSTAEAQIRAQQLENEIALLLRKRDAVRAVKQAEAIKVEMTNAAQSNAALAQEIAGLKEKAKTLNMTADQLTIYTIAQNDANIADAQAAIADYERDGSSAAQARIVQLQERIRLTREHTDAVLALANANALKDRNDKAKESAKQFAEDWKQTAASINASLTDALLRGFESGKSFAENFKETLVNMFKTMVLRPVISFILQPISNAMSTIMSPFANFGKGAMPGIGAIPGLGGAGGGDIFSSLASGGGMFNLFGEGAFGAGSLFGNGGLMGSLTGGTGGIFGAGGMGAGLATSALGESLGLSVAMGAGEGMALTALGSTLGAALPILGIALAAYMMFKKPRGGPKTGGASNNIPGLEDFFTPNQSDKEANALADTTLASYNQLLQAMGGKGTALFDFGFDSDPEGTASDRIRGGVMVNGQLLYDTGNIETGRDNAVTQAALELEAKRALLAALQASDLPAAVKDMLNSVTARTASAEDVDRILRVGTAFGSIYELFNSDVMEDGLTAYADSLRGVGYQIGKQIEAVADLAEKYDGSADAAEGLAAATQELYQSGVQAIGAIEQLKTQLVGLFEQDATNYRIAGMDNAQQRTYWEQMIDQWTAELQTSTDANRINELAGMIRGGQQSLWGLLTPEERAANSEAFAIAAEAAGALIAERLSVAQTAIQTAIETTLTGVRDLFVPIGATQTAAANTMRDAANTLLIAARTPINLQAPVGAGSEVTGT